MTDDVATSDESPGDGAPTHMDSINRAVFGLLVGTLLAVVISFAIIWISDDVAGLMLRAARSFAWHSIVAWGESPDAAVQFTKGLALAAPICVCLAVAIVLFRSFRREMGPKSSRITEPEEPVSIRSMLSFYGGPATWIGWFALYLFFINMFLFKLPQTFLDGAMEVLRIPAAFSGIGSDHPVWDRIDSIDKWPRLLILISAAYFYLHSEIKRAAKLDRARGVIKAP